MWTSIGGAPLLLAGYISDFPSVRSYLQTGQHFHDWVTGLAVASIVIALISNAVAHSRSQLIATDTPETQTQANPASPSQFRNVDEFYRTYDNRMLRETEDFIRNEVEKYEPSQREKFLVRLLATVVTLALFERAWLQIFRSQLDALHALNVRTLSFDELRQRYEEAVKLHPKIYENGTFEMWLGFLKLSLLARELNPTTIEITVRGQEFLKYLVEVRYDESTRVG